VKCVVSCQQFCGVEPRYDFKFCNALITKPSQILADLLVSSAFVFGIWLVEGCRGVVALLEDVLVHLQLLGSGRRTLSSSMLGDCMLLLAVSLVW